MANTVELTSTLSQIGDASDWKEFGLPGLVIFALFIAIFLGVKVFVGALKAVIATHGEDVKGLQTAHLLERKEWRVEDKAAREEFTKSLKGVGDSITQLQSTMLDEIRRTNK